MKNLNHFFSSGSCSDEIIEIKGTVKNGIFTSELITGAYTQKFYNELAKKAKQMKKYIRLVY